MAVIGETKFIKYTVAILTDMRMVLAQAISGCNEFRRKC